MTEKKRILVVDDDDAIRTLLSTVLGRRGLVVDSARNGVEALEHCRLCSYSLILLDLMMPRMNGYDFLTQLDAISFDTQPIVIVLTAGLEPRPESRLVSALVRKPFDISLLLDAVSGALASRDAATQPPDCPPAGTDGMPKRTPKPN
ncbi:MAG TPA: response regulator [Thermoanaerobaculia bacterium]|nr:response regulator [Thermoanaerobaculia bacterium]